MYSVSNGLVVKMLDFQLTFQLIVAFIFCLFYNIWDVGFIS